MIKVKDIIKEARIRDLDISEVLLSNIDLWFPFNKQIIGFLKWNGDLLIDFAEDPFPPYNPIRDFYIIVLVIISFLTLKIIIKEDSNG